MTSNTLKKTEFYELTGEIIDLRRHSNHPISFLYSEIYSSAILDGKIIHGRIQPRFSLINAPFVIAAKKGMDYRNEKNKLKKIQESLICYYNNFQPQNALEYIGLTYRPKSILNELPPWGAIYPWRARTAISYMEAYSNAVAKENKCFGYEYGIEKGWIFSGPISMEKSLIEAKRIEYVLKEISTNGYKRSNESDGDIRATALVKGNSDWRWIVTSGFHRASAVAALGYKSVPIRINLVISREQVDFWPQVINGLYTREEALYFFDTMFEGELP